MSSRADHAAEDLLRGLAPQVLGALVRRYGNFHLAEDATQEALLAASRQWTTDGLPDRPKAWLIRVASRRLTDLLRSEQARRRREEVVAAWALSGPDPVPPQADDTLILLFMCCHPSLSPPSQIALTLRAVGGLTTAQVARAFLVPEATMTRRITRAKESIHQSGLPFRLPPAQDRGERLDAVLHVLYLIFNEGYAATSGPHLQRLDLTAEAIRLCRLLHDLLPHEPEVTGLLALMLLVDARRGARTSRDGSIVPMAEQDRTLWDEDRIDEGLALVAEALPRGPGGPYQVQAAIAALHDEAPSYEATDWPQILALYDLLVGLRDNPMVSLNRAVAVAYVHGATAGLAEVDRLAGDPRLERDHRLHAVRAHLLEMCGDGAAARRSYERAAELSTSLPRQRYLHGRARSLAGS